ncbi:hypothetical protein Fmac_001450 [Flemingia macrophylla]|uniref:Uncharacterized protein n=1 Tax=Flemingia macrophylla TaxID=520843 RepID=A0ABD1NJY1_9FABA
MEILNRVKALEPLKPANPTGQPADKAGNLSQLQSFQRILTKPTKHFSTGAVTHLLVSGYFSGTFRDPFSAFSRWPYGSFSWADHHITWSISGSYTTIDLPSGSAAGDGNPTVVTKFIPFFFSSRIVIVVLFFSPRIVRVVLAASIVSKSGQGLFIEV